MLVNSLVCSLDIVQEIPQWWNVENVLSFQKSIFEHI